MAKCKKCGASIIWITTTGGKMMPCDPDQVMYWKGGKERIVTPNGEVVACSLVGPVGEQYGVGYIPHWSTCGK